MQPDDTQTREFATADMRRSPRILRRVVVRIDHADSFSIAHTAVINRHGGLIVCRVGYDEGTQVQVTNLRSGESARFRVVWCSDAEDGHFRIGVELLDALDFWGSAYDPGPGD